MRFVIAPDSYKGCLTSAEAGQIMARALREEMPDSEIHIVPMADGGEGTVDALVKAAGGQLVRTQITGPLGELTESFFGIIEDSEDSVAVIETAAICGLPMVPEERRNPMLTTTRGLGETIREALNLGIRRFVIGLGGSATNDGGLGMLTALGARFKLKDGSAAEGFGRELGALSEASFEGLDSRLSECRIIIACDVTNPLLGELGASYVFGPQKGATPEQVLELDAAMRHYAGLVERQLSKPLRDTPGTGAAGGLGFAFIALGAQLVPGAQIVEDMTGLGGLIAAADWVFTGEGRSDRQTLYGKLPYHVAQLAKKAGKPVTLISGSLGEGSEELHAHFTGCFSIVRAPSDLEANLEAAEFNLFECTRSVARLILHTFADSRQTGNPDE
ncbi:glycerate kinase [Paenibacillus nanensis]|uniref:Glycerate kinase n=1 Tax=Paenibacillus nanensis TaxID=393251 RepID=A0A3A1VGH4_9BACL|nr:glycerate kinase [Paenibacillus nanensis]RIX59481.1 glycerate kinase [Paenibacillus nanensis]